MCLIFRVKFRESDEDYDDTIPLLVFNENIKCINSNFSYYEDIGIILTNYAEFAVWQLNSYETDECFSYFKLNNIEVSLGNPTPLMQYLFGINVFSNDYLDSWNGIQTLRFYGDIGDSLELRLLQALLSFGEIFKTIFILVHLNESYYSYPEEDLYIIGQEINAPITDQNKEIKNPEYCINDIDTLRLFHSGLIAGDAENSFLQFYKILEYYSILYNIDNLSKFRWDRTVSKTEFRNKILKLVRRDEKSQICQLIQYIITPEISKTALKHKLITSTDNESLGEALYKFRNSIVHAKYAYQGQMRIPTLFSDSSTIKEWKIIVQALAKNAIKTFGIPDH